MASALTNTLDVVPSPKSNDKVVLGPWAIEVNKLDELPKIVPMYCEGDQIASPCITYEAIHIIIGRCITH